MKRFQRWPQAVLAALTFFVILLVVFPPSFEEIEPREDVAANELRGWKSLAKTPMPRVTAQPTATTRVTRKIMANKIAHGSTGQATFLRQDTDLNDTTRRCDTYLGWTLSNGDYYVFSTDPMGWSVSNSGQVSPPSEAPGGFYLLSVHIPDNVNPEQSNYECLFDIYEFEVVCMTAKVNVTSANPTNTFQHTATATNQGGTAPFSYTWTLPEGAFDISGDGNTRTFRLPKGNRSNKPAVSCTITEAGGQNPCTATATADFCPLFSTNKRMGEALNLQPSEGGTKYRNFYQASVTASSWSGPTSVVYSCDSPDISVGASREDNVTGSGIWFCDVYANFDFEDEQQRVLNYLASDAAGCTEAGSFNFSVKGTDIGPPNGCPTGQHDDGTGVCVPDEPTGPQPCASGYVWNGSACVPDDPIEPPPTEPPTGLTLRWICDCDSASCVSIYTSNAALGYATQAQCEANCHPVTVDPTLAVPAAPMIARDCEAGALVVTAPAFPANAVSLETARDDGEIIVHLFEDAGDWSDAGVALGPDYRYRCRCVNSDDERSEWGEWSAAVSLVSAIVVEWLAPDDGAIVGGLVPLRARVTAPDGAPVAVTFEINGAPRAGARAPGDASVWVALLDLRDFEFQGEIDLVVWARDAGGCRTLDVARRVRLNSSLRRDGSYFDLLLEPRDVATMLADNRRVSKLAMVGEFVRGELLGLSPAHDSFWETRLACPDPGADAGLDKFALARFNKPMLMSGDGMNETARARIIERPVEIAVKFQTGCDRISKIRLLPAPDPAPTKEQLQANPSLQTSDVLGVFGRGDGADRRAAWFRFDEDGLHPIVDLSAAGLPGAFDACQTQTGELVVCDASGLFVIDPDYPLDFQQLRRPAGETRAARAVERAGSLVYFWFGDDEVTNLYVRDGENLAARGQLVTNGKFIRSFAVRNIVLFCVLNAGNYEIYRFEAGADVPDPTLVYSSSIAVTSLAAFTARAGETDVPPQVARYTELLARWGDESGAVREAATAGVAVDVAALSAPVSALGLFRGADLEARGVAGAGASGAGATVWRENGSGIYAPERGWAGALEVSALHRLEIAVGEEPDQTFEESLVGGTQGTVDDAAFVFRVQQSEPARERGVLVGDLALRAVGTAPV